MFVSIVNVANASLISVFYCWFANGSLNVDEFLHPIPIMYVDFISQVSLSQTRGIFSLPWNQTTLLGYSGEIASIMIFSVTFFLSNGLFLLLFISLCIYHGTFYEIIARARDEFNRHNKNRCDTKFLGDLIQFHASIKE